MLATIQSLLFFLSAFNIGPNVALPPALEVCILKAEVCIQDLQAPLCGGLLPDLDAAEPCSEPFETCAEPFSEAHEPACRLDYIWCVIESTADMQEEHSDYLKWCGEVYETCPSSGV